MNNCESCRLTTMGKGYEAQCYRCLDSAVREQAATIERLEGERRWMCKVLKIEELEAQLAKQREALKAIKDDYEHCELNPHGERAHAYYETACKALLGEQT